MHQHMNVSDKVAKSDMKQTDMEHDYCNQNSCDMSHCASAFTAVMTSNNLNDVTYTAASIQLKSNISLIQFYPSSLYRPPKI